MSFHKDALTIPGDMVLKTILQLQTVVGALVNVILFLYSVSPGLLGHKKVSTYVILTHMALASLLVLLALGVLHTMATFLSENPLSSLGCKLCITYGEWLSAPPCAPLASWAPISPSLSPPGEQSGWCSEEGPPGSLALPAAPAGCSVS